MDENLADIKIRKQLGEAKVNPCLPTYAGNQATNRGYTFRGTFSHITKSSETDEPTGQLNFSPDVLQIKKTRPTHTAAPGKLSCNRRSAARPTLISHTKVGKDVVSSAEAKEIYSEKKEVNGE